MAIQDDDLLYVQRPFGPDAGEYKLTAGNLKTDLNDEYLSKTTDDTAAGKITLQGGANLPGITNASGLATDADGNIIAGTGGGGGFWTEDSGNLYPTTLTDNVGIGTASPLAKLDIKSEGDGAELLRLSTERSWSFYQKSTGASSKLELRANSSKAFEITGKQGGEDFVPTVLVSTGSGLVGINTDSPQDPLHVNGNVRIENVKNAASLATNADGRIIDGGGEAVKLKNSRNLWGQPFNGTADVKGAIVGATNITGTNANMTVRPNAGGNKALYLKGGESNDGSTSGAVYMGESKGGNLHFQHGSGGKFRFYKSGGGNFGILDFDNCTGTRTYSYPNWSGNVVITTTGSANAETRFSKIITDNNNWFKKGWLCASTSNYSPYNATSGNGVSTDNNTFNCNRTTTEQHSPTMWVNRCGASLKGAWIRFQFDGSDPDQTEIKQNGQGKVNFRGLNTSYRTDMDARKVGNSLTDITNATAVIKALEPKREGFIAQKVGRLIAHAVDSLNETQTVELGTHTNIDGVEFTRVEQPEAIPYGETWVKTEDYDLPVGLDQAALIPFLTKALQEAFARIEQLEADHATMMNNNNGGNY